jgi:hypothetical protein
MLNCNSECKYLLTMIIFIFEFFAKILLFSVAQKTIKNNKI